MKAYELSEVFHHSEESSANEILKMEHISYVYEEGVGNTFVMKKNASSTNALAVGTQPLKKVSTTAADKKKSPASSPTLHTLTTQRDAEVVQPQHSEDQRLQQQLQQLQKLQQLEEEEEEEEEAEEELKNDNDISSVAASHVDFEPVKQHGKEGRVAQIDDELDTDDRNGATVKNIIDIYSKKRQKMSRRKQHRQRQANTKKAHHHKKDVRKIRKSPFLTTNHSEINRNNNHIQIN